MLPGFAQFFERRGKSAPTARDYVQNGLIAMWDGIENAGWGVHDANATTWKDLIGNYDLTKNPDATWTDDSLFIAVRKNLAYTASTISSVGTIEACFDLSYESSNGQGRGLVCLTNQRAMMGAGLIGIRSRGEQSVQMIGTQNTLISAFSASVVYATAPSNDKIFFNGVEQSVESAAGNWGLLNNLVIGAISVAGSGSVGVIGKCHCVRIYSGALTVPEIAANYAIDRARFNLP